MEGLAQLGADIDGRRRETMWRRVSAGESERRNALVWYLSRFWCARSNYTRLAGGSEQRSTRSGNSIYALVDETTSPCRCLATNLRVPTGGPLGSQGR